MPVFVYTARDRSGNQTTGMVEADSNSVAVAQLREQGLWVTDLRQRGRQTREQPSGAPVPGVERSVAKRIASPVSLKDLALFYRQLHTLLNSGMALFQSLELLCSPNQTPNAALRRVAQALGQHVLQGGRLSEAMARYPWLFDRMQIRMVEAGEAGGLLVDVVRRLAEYLEREFEVRLDIKRKTLYPKLVLGLLVLVLPVNIPLTLGGYFSSLFGLLALIAMVGIPLWLVARIFLTSSGGRTFYDQVKLAVPIIGTVVRKLAAARFARTLAALYGAGVPIASALAVAGESCGHYVLEQSIARSVAAVEHGTPVAQVLEATHFFPPMFTGMVRTGETSGNLDTMLDKAADFYDHEASHATTQLVVILGVVLLICVAILVL
ncbi:MAG TPA: type II secretion system F family protein, partial [Armatimonadota bacterium]|nr:type II secretion system F family protein [Armatimonadota bacterium]